MYPLLTQIVTYSVLLVCCTTSGASEGLVTVLGHVKTPGDYQLPDDSEFRVSDAIAIAGGTAASNPGNVVVSRCLRHAPHRTAIRMTAAHHNLILGPGDILFVEKSNSEDTPSVVEADDDARLSLRLMDANSTIIRFKSMSFQLDANGDPIVVFNRVSLPHKDGITLTAETMSVKLEQLVRPSTGKTECDRQSWPVDR